MSRSRVRDLSDFAHVILDMDELTTIGLSVIGTLVGWSYPTRSWSWVRLHMHVVGCVCAWNFRTNSF